VVKHASASREKRGMILLISYVFNGVSCDGFRIDDALCPKWKLLYIDSGDCIEEALQWRPLYGRVLVSFYRSSNLLHDIPIAVQGGIAVNRIVSAEIVDACNNPLVPVGKVNLEVLSDFVGRRFTDLVNKLDSGE
jgi:hypothetical protein